MLPTEKQLKVRSSATAIMPFDESRDPVRRFDESILRFIRKDKTHMMIAEVVRAPGIHRCDRDVFFL